MASVALSTPKKRTRGLPVTEQGLNNAKALIGAGAFYVLFLGVIVGWLYPTMATLNMDAYLSSDAATGLLGVRLTHASSFTAIIGVELYSAFYDLLFGGIVAYIAGAALPLTIENGTLDLALARPISRTRYYTELWFSALLAGVITSLVTAFAVWLSSLFVKNAGVDWTWLAIAQLLQFAFFFFAVGVGLLFGSLLNTSRAAGGAAVAIIIIAYAINGFGSISNNFSWLLKIDPFYYAGGVQALVQHDFTRWHPWVLVAVGLICGIVGLVIFNRRDLPTT